MKKSRCLPCFVASSFVMLLLLLFTSLFSLVLGESVDPDVVVAVDTKKKNNALSLQSFSYHLYQHQGTAQSYKPNAPESTFICKQSSSPPLSSSSKQRHRSSHGRSKVATWPLTRSKSLAVRLKLKIQLWSCASHDGIDTQNCQNLFGNNNNNNNSHQQHVSSNNIINNITMEVWQARPDGTYSSLSAKDDYDCRTLLSPTTLQQIAVTAAAAPDSSSKSIDLDTYAPGSTGCLGGLGPVGWDFPPYGPPVIHFLIDDDSYRHGPLLLNVPIIFHHKTLQQYSNPFTAFWSDWRGSAWVSDTTTTRRRDGNNSGRMYEIHSWEPDVQSRQIAVGMNLFLIRNPDIATTQEQSVTTSTSSTKKKRRRRLLCPSWFFSPKSFFLEPIAVCSPWLLDFFAI